MSTQPKHTQSSPSASTAQILPSATLTARMSTATSNSSAANHAASSTNLAAAKYVWTLRDIESPASATPLPRGQLDNLLLLARKQFIQSNLSHNTVNRELNFRP